MDEAVRQYLIKKNGLVDPNQPSEPTEEEDVPSPVPTAVTPSATQFGTKPSDDETLNQLTEAQNQANNTRFNAGLGEGLSDIFSSLAGKKQDSSGFYGNMIKNADAKSQNILTKSKLASDLNSQRRASQLNDPNSAPSKLFQSALTKLYGDKFTAEQIATLSAADKDIVMDPLKLEETLKTREAVSKYNSDSRKEARDERIAEKQRRNQEQDVQKLSKDLSGTQDMVNALDEVEGQLGFKLDDADTSGGTLKVAGKDKDLPGVSIPVLGRVSAYSGDARKLSGAVAKVFNTVLKDRSGAAVSNQELERLKNEFGEGRYNTEPEMVNALQRYKRATNVEMKNREAAYNKDAVQTYKDQGGRTSDSVTSPSVNSPAQSKPKTVSQNGHTYTLNEKTGEYE